MKKVLLATLLVSAGVLSLATASTNAHAEEVVKADQTDLQITIDPDGGSKPGENPLQKNLAIAFIPSNMNFGTNANTGKGSGAVKVFKDKEIKKSYLVVSDDRTAAEGAKLAKWQTVAQLSDFAVDGSTEEADKLANVQLEFNTGAVQDYALVKDEEGNITSAPDPSTNGVLTIHKGTDITALPVKATAGGSAVPVLTKAQENDTNGAYATEITDRQLRVALPQSQAGKTFTAQLTWSLEDTFQ
ncbi:WxL domain-containing protein [Enterococcus sp. AZ126]|uniref:WxL domain-containing protein n=1 Tax=Enterococcus sp. AZ126 TaxID=2774635 RepID=UPI003F290F2E